MSPDEESDLMRDDKTQRHKTGKANLSLGSGEGVDTRTYADEITEYLDRGQSTQVSDLSGIATMHI